MCHGKTDEIESLKTSGEIRHQQSQQQPLNMLTQCCGPLRAPSGSCICGNCEQPRSERRRRAKPHDKSLPPEDPTGSSCWKSQLAVLSGAEETHSYIFDCAQHPSSIPVYCTLCSFSFLGDLKCSTRTKKHSFLRFRLPAGDSSSFHFACLLLSLFASCLWVLFEM